MLKITLVALLSFNMLFGGGSADLLSGLNQQRSEADTGILQKMIVTNGDVALALDVNRLNGTVVKKSPGALRFEIERDSFFTIMVFNDELRGPLPGSMNIAPLDSVALPAKLDASYRNLVIENLAWGGPHDLVIRDRSTGFTFFNIEGYVFDYEPTGSIFNLQMGRVSISKEFAAELGRPSEAGAVVGELSISAKVQAVEVTEIANGDVKGSELPPVENAGTVPGPDVVVGDLNGLAQFGNASGNFVGLAVGTDSCNFGTVNLRWIANPSNDHPVIPQNMYRMSGGTDNQERFEQIGQSNVKHAFTALTQNICGLGCNGVGGTALGSGCSDPYNASLNSGPNLGSRAWINPFTGDFPRNDSATPNNSHGGHSHTGPSHRILTPIADLNTTLNPGATYFAEGQYITPHEYVHCQANPTQCNQYNNVSYRQYNVSGTASPFSFSQAGATVRTKAAIVAWTGASLVAINPAPGADGIGTLGYKVTQTSPGVWHYEYAIYNQNIDRGIQSFSIPVGSGVTLSNIGFHAPPQQPGWTGDGTVGNAGFSSTPWTGVQTGSDVTWSSESFAQNQNANALRWGTLYNYRFDSNRPPQTVNATIGFFKTGAPITVQVQGPAPAVAQNVSVGGRVTRTNGVGIGFVYVYITDANNVTRGTLTSPFGYYNFDNVLTGQQYTVGALKKSYDFTSQVITVNDNITDLNFMDDPFRTMR